MKSNSKLTFFDKPIVELKEVSSTNSYLKEIENTLPTLVCADFQTAGRGQYGKIWTSTDCENLLFSFQFFPSNSSIQSANLISQLVAIEIVTTINLKLNEEKCSIKWPNDIILKNKKIGGILIETSLRNYKIEQFIIGIGINIGQNSFDSSLPNASSLAIEYPDIFWDKYMLLSQLIPRLEAMIFQEKKGINPTEVMSLFNMNQYKFNQQIQLKKGEQIQDFINLGVNNSGQWLVKNKLTDEIMTINSSSEIEYIY